MISLRSRGMRHVAIGFVFCAAVGASGAVARATAGTTEPGAATSEPTARAVATFDEAIAALLPADIRESGVVRVVTSAGVPPIVFFDDDGATLIGSDPDLAAALGEVLGVEFELTNISFDGVIAGLDAGRFDMAIAGMFDTVERQEKFNFIDYLDAGYTIGLPTGNPAGIAGPEDLCGHTLAVEKGSLAEEIGNSVVEQCSAEGDDVTLQPYPDFVTVVQSLDSGRSDAAIGGGAVFTYMAQKLDLEIETVPGFPFGAGTIGMAIPKDNEELLAAVKAAMDELVADGVYAQILADWGATSYAVEAVRVNEPIGG